MDTKINIEQLREPAEVLKFITTDGVSAEEGKEIVNKLLTAMSADPSLLCLAAPQIGINKRIFCLKFSDCTKVFINPIITKKSGNVIAPETFSSFPGKEFLIARPTEVTVIYTNGDFKNENNKFLGLAARAIDQMAQLLDGVLPDELGLVSDVEECGSLFDATDEEMQEYAEIYKKFVAAKVKALTAEINADKDIEKQYRMLKFTEDVITGHTQVVQDTGVKKNRAQRRNDQKVAKKIKAKKR